MKELASIQEYSQITGAFQKSRGKLYTNCFLMPDEISRLIEKRKLRFCTEKDALLFLCDRTDYQTLYYYLTPEAPLPDLSSLYEDTGGNQEILFDIPYSERRPAREHLLLAQMTARGMVRRYKCYQRMELFLEKWTPADASHEISPGYRLLKEPQPFPRVHSLWKTALDEKSTPLPDCDQLMELQEKGLLFCTEHTASGQLCAAAALHIHGKQGTLQHLAVLPRHRRHGLAGALCHMVLAKGIQSGLKIIKLWVDKENTPAIALYTRKGFVPDQMACDQYLIERSIKS